MALGFSTLNKGREKQNTWMHKRICIQKKWSLTSSFNYIEAITCCLRDWEPEWARPTLHIQTCVSVNSALQPNMSLTMANSLIGRLSFKTNGKKDLPAPS